MSAASTGRVPGRPRHRHRRRGRRAGFIPGFTEQIEGIAAGRDPHHRGDLPRGLRRQGTGRQGGRDSRSPPSRCAGPSCPPSMMNWPRKSVSRAWRSCASVVRGEIQREYDQLSRLRLKRQLLDALAEMITFDSPEGMVDSRVRPDLAAAGGRSQGRSAGRGRQGQGRGQRCGPNTAPSPSGVSDWACCSPRSAGSTASALALTR